MGQPVCNVVIYELVANSGEVRFVCALKEEKKGFCL